MSEIFILLFIFLVVLLAWMFFIRKPRHSLPGPKGLPFIGILHKLDYSKMPEQLTQIGKNYKGLFYIGLNIGVVDNKETALEVLVKQDPRFADRDDGHQFFADVALGKKDLFFGNYNETLQRMRKATFQALHLHGPGLQRLEAIIQEELRTFLDNIEEGQDINPKDMVYGAVINIMTSILLGEKFSYESEEVRCIHDLDQAFARITPLTAPEVNRFPWMLHLPLPRYIRKKQQVNDYLRLRDDVLAGFVDKYKVSYDPGNIHCVLSSLCKTQEIQGPDVFTDKMISNIMLDLILAGSETTSTSMTGLLFVLAHKPEVQDRMYREIQEVVGDGRMPRAEDKDSLPYVRAVILELLRYQSVAPLNVPRIAAADAEVNGLFIPKTTMLFINQWAIHHNPEAWERPYDFYPQHFLDDQGHLLPVDVYKNKGFLPFGAGRRACLGETLAKSRLFLMTSAIVQRFKVLPPANEEFPALTLGTFIHTVVMKAPDYWVQFVARG